MRKPILRSVSVVVEGVPQLCHLYVEGTWGVSSRDGYMMCLGADPHCQQCKGYGLLDDGGYSISYTECQCVKPLT